MLPDRSAPWENPNLAGQLAAAEGVHTNDNVPQAQTGGKDVRRLADVLEGMNKRLGDTRRAPSAVPPLPTLAGLFAGVNNPLPTSALAPVQRAQLVAQQRYIQSVQTLDKHTQGLASAITSLDQNLRLDAQERAAAALEARKAAYARDQKSRAANDNRVGLIRAPANDNGRNGRDGENNRPSEAPGMISSIITGISSFLGGAFATKLLSGLKSSIGTLLRSLIPDWARGKFPGAPPRVPGVPPGAPGAAEAAGGARAGAGAVEGAAAGAARPFSPNAGAASQAGRLAQTGANIRRVANPKMVARLAGRGLARFFGPLAIIITGLACYQELSDLWGAYNTAQITWNEFRNKAIVLIAAACAGTAGALILGEIFGALGAAAGTIIPGVGNVVLGLAGGVIGGALGFFAGEKVGKYVAERLVDWFLAGKKTSNAQAPQTGKALPMPRTANAAPAPNGGGMSAMPTPQIGGYTGASGSNAAPTSGGYSPSPSSGSSLRPGALRDAGRPGAGVEAVTSQDALTKTAASYLGANENNSGDQKRLQGLFRKGGMNLNPADTAWCAAFVNGVLGANGMPVTGSNLARSFANYGTSSNNDPQPGDIVVFARGSDNTKGHVGILQGFDKNRNPIVLGGNQSNQVSVETQKRDKVLAYRRPSGGTAKPASRAPAAPAVLPKAAKGMPKKAAAEAAAASSRQSDRMRQQSQGGTTVVHRQMGGGQGPSPSPKPAPGVGSGDKSMKLAVMVHGNMR